MDKDIILAIQQTETIDELVRQFEELLSIDISDTPKGKQRLKANQLAKDILAKYNGDYSNVSPEDKAALRDYTGFGGIGGSTNEYYTPKWIAEAAWDALRSYGFTGGSVLEPSAGVGVFSETKPKGTLSTSVEMDQTSAAINQILHPEDHVINSAFEAIASDPSIGGFDAIIGNPPYGVRDASAMNDGEYKDIQYADQYFVTRSIDKAKAGGLIALVLPTRICDGKSLEKWRVSLALKAEFLGAHRLPTGTFADTGVVTDLVIWRKHSEHGKELIDSVGRDTLISAGVLWDTWLKGKWFERDGKKFINGEQTTKGVGKFARKVVDRGNRSNNDIKAALTRRFDSRIDWSLLGENVELPESIKYADGDTMYRNGIQYEMIDGEWEVSENNAKQGNVDKSVYGVTDTANIGPVTYSTESMLSLSASQALKIYEDYQYLCHDEFKALMREVSKLPTGQQEHAYKGILLGKKVKTLSTMVAGSRSRSVKELAFSKAGHEDLQVEEYRTKLGGQILELNALLGGSHVSGKALNVLDESLISDWRSYQSAVTKNGKLSDLLKGELRVEFTNQYNSSKIGDVFHFCERELGHSTLTLDQIRVYYTAHITDSMTDDQLLDYLAGMDEVAVNPDGTVQAMHRACTGHVGRRVALLTEQLVNATSEPIKANVMRQLATIDEKRNKIAISDVRMKLTDKWIPKHIMLEFLHDQGYTEFVRGTYKKTKIPKLNATTGEVELTAKGDIRYVTQVEFTEDPNGKDFSGYRYRDGREMKSPDEAFERQIESYVNDGQVRGGNSNADKSLMRSRISQLDDEFSNWLAASDYSDELELRYNDTFNSWIKPEFDDSPLGLNGVSGAIEFLPYQNSTIRRHSADGNGIIAFGTGLGKTLTGLGLIQHNLDTKRASRVAVVVPKSVLENWFYESDLFFGEGNLGDKVFIGLEVAKDDKGRIIREPEIDEDGEPKLDKKNEPILRAKLKVDTNGKRIAQQLHDLTQSKARIVVMTKDVYNRIPMKPETIADNVLEMKEAGLVAGSHKLVKEAESHRDKEKNARFENKYSDDGTAKNNELPYFEDLLFDSVMVDEAHDFRNSYKGGSYRNNLAFLPSQAQADRAIDMQVKNNVIKARNGGNGVYFLTATPTVNSPVDMFNMLSHIVPADTFAQMGIFDSDDFIRMFGKTGEALVTKLSGEVENREALLGFQNLDALRNIVNRYMTMEDAKSVGADVHIPDLVAAQTVVQMNSEQEALYEELRQRADAISNPDKEENQEIIEQFPDDTVFGLIRKMDKISTDLDLYYDQVTYRFAKGKVKEVQAALDTLPATVTIQVEQVSDDGTVKMVNQKVKLEKEIVIEGNHAVVRLRQEFDDEFSAACEKAKLKYSHPVSPKYAKFLEKAKEIYLAGGKQLVFTEEKSQHKKLARIIADHTGCKLSEIGILNSDTVAGKKNASVSEDKEEAGLEALAKAYNTGKYKFMILNKKGEVGINLHRGTTDIHHLTLPWTPMSITQRNGRGARVGSKQKKVNVHYYTSKGSFDDFRLATIQRKASWVETMFKGNDKFLANADADSADETAIMLAANPEQAKARIEAAKREAERKRKQEELRQASISVSKYVNATSTLSFDVEEAQSELEQLNNGIDELRQEVEDAREKSEDKDRSSYEYREFVRIKNRLFERESKIRAIERVLANRKKASDTLKKLRPTIEKAISGGILKDYPDFLSNPELFMVKNGIIVRQGYTYKVAIKSRSWAEEYDIKAVMTITRLNRQDATVDGYLRERDGESYNGGYSDLPVSKIIELAPVNQERTEIETLALRGVPLNQVASTFDRETYFELVADKKIRAYGTESARLVLTADGQYKTPYGFDLKPDEQLIYPDPTDKAVFNGLMAQVVNDFEQYGKATMNTNILSFFLGRNWQEQAKEQGNKATEQDVAERIALEIKEFESKNPAGYTDALLRLSSHWQNSIPFCQEVETHIKELSWRGYVNRIIIDTWTRTQLSRYFSALKEKSEDYNAEQEDLVFAQFVKVAENDPDRPARLRAIAELMKKYVAQHKFSEKLEELYSGDKQQAMIHAMADQQAAGLRNVESGDGMLYKTSRSLDDVLYTFIRVFNSRDKQEFIDKHINAAKPEPVKVTLTEKQQDKLSNIDAINVENVDQLIESLSGLGIEAKMVTENMSWKSKAGRRWYTGSIAAYSMIGLMDLNGKDGALAVMFKGDKETKAQYGAKFANDASEAFTGSWWFISATSDLSLLAKSLATIHNTLTKAA
ncbi:MULTISPECIES: SNF2-related protein [unclassified Vibrio]|uniref:SNF2-related protein n=1 Tax=unclassified Vibrio TaxID=2614977 RepID=UPI0012679CA8|nr:MULTISPECIES: SNF2-related protein [unclassified Vibrio]QFT40027.1 hypothetical protein FIU99_26925 [Vibrio sp. THAF64]QGM37972.1 hypothetical protein GGC04_27130 [Vibrio sp. THAF191d]QGN73448.1 hypothetical protein GGC03_27045 [Vibrio sp. THAF191c]